MKFRKLLSLILAICLMTSLLFACGKTDGKEEEPEEETPEIMQTSDPAEDDTLNILMIGHSFCYYYADELYSMLTAAGIKARVCNLYESGCTLDEHWEWWKNDSSSYESFVCHDENGRQSTENISLRWALQQQNWDIISLQSGIDVYYSKPAKTTLHESATQRSDLIGFLKEQFPYADHYWHQFWAFQAGFNKFNYAVVDSQQQKAYSERAREFAIATCAEYDLGRINTGEAWEIVRDGGYDNLCARMDVNGGEGDYYHDGDIGGGQYLNACVWFEVLTGQSCVGSTWRPAEYHLDEDLIPVLQQAAHQAVLNLSATN